VITFDRSKHVLMTMLARTQTSPRGDDGSGLSPVYALAVQHQALWLLSGTESGGINVQTVRHQEGTRITCLRGHNNAVSVLTLAQDEISVLSGSWDKTINDWDLNTGQIKRKFETSGGQISAIELRPFSTVPVPQEVGTRQPRSSTFSSNNATRPAVNGLANGTTERAAGKDSDAGVADTIGSPDNDHASLFGDDNNDHESLFGDSREPAGDSGVPALDEEDDEFSRQALGNFPQQQEEETQQDVDMLEEGGPVKPPEPIVQNDKPQDDMTQPNEQLANGVGASHSQSTANGLPHAESMSRQGSTVNGVQDDTNVAQTSDTTFLDASHDGTLRVWDRRQPNPIARIIPPRTIPPWCMNACWSPDGNYIYAGRRNGTVDEYSLHKGLREPKRTFKFPPVSGPVSAVRAMPNGRHLIWYVCFALVHSTMTKVWAALRMISFDFMT
jgi:transcriptional activator SPT8